MVTNFTHSCRSYLFAQQVFGNKIYKTFPKIGRLGLKSGEQGNISNRESPAQIGRVGTFALVVSERLGKISKGKCKTKSEKKELKKKDREQDKEVETGTK